MTKDSDTFKAILTYYSDGEVEWAYDDFRNWEAVREEVAVLAAEAEEDISYRIVAVSNHGHSLEVSKEERKLDM